MNEKLCGGSTSHRASGWDLRSVGPISAASWHLSVAGVTNGCSFASGIDYSVHVITMKVCPTDAAQAARPEPARPVRHTGQARACWDLFATPASVIHRFGVMLALVCAATFSGPDPLQPHQDATSRAHGDTLSILKGDFWVLQTRVLQTKLEGPKKAGRQSV